MDLLAQARSLAAGGEVGKAIDLLEQAVAMGEESSLICKEIARLCLSVNEVRAFTNWCHEAMRLDPFDGEPQLMIARVLVSQQRWGEAVESLDQAVRAVLPGAGERAEVAELLQLARTHYEEWKRLHPGASNL
jgi:tetratricopeptide (TPR) repeat protein